MNLINIKGKKMSNRNDPFEFVGGEDIMVVPDDNREPLVENILYPMDYVLMAAEQKTGKTIFLQQLAMSMSCGKPFIGMFDIPKPLKVAYIATEGKLGDLRDRFSRMKASIEYNHNNMLLIRSKVKFNGDNSGEYLRWLVGKLEGMDFIPDVIIVDPIYNVIAGSLTSDDVINQFNDVIFRIINEFGCAVIVAHHLKKAQKDSDGKFFRRSDEDVFGSMFLSAAVDHVLRMERYNKGTAKDLVIKCDTQRSGNIIDKFRVHMVEPDPLYLKYMDICVETKNKIHKIMNSSSDGLFVGEIIDRSKLSKSTVSPILTLMVEEGTLEKFYIDRKMKYRRKA